MRVKRRWLTVEDKIKEKEYIYDNKIEIPKCPRCSSKLYRVTHTRNYQKIRIHLGYYCKGCEHVYILKKYKLFRVELNGKENC